jgi:hypothetical protein
VDIGPVNYPFRPMDQFVRKKQYVEKIGRKCPWEVIRHPLWTAKTEKFDKYFLNKN